jgi:large subunit ribosomal protein L6
MSRIGKKPVNLPKGVSVKVSADNVVSVKGPLGELSQKVDPDITVNVEGNEVVLTRPTDQKASPFDARVVPCPHQQHGCWGIKGFEIQQELVGVGYKAEAKGQVLELSLGYSHDIHFLLPNEVKVEAKTERRGNPTITLRSIDKQLLG